ncbi:chemotaxis protein CheA [Palleronia abyssalis]|uniref:Chemotaxis protein CheA n=1 Tax=Palleronia abyssalis TaxID=1501240 RepID=A0A2R8BTU3_9RHOB|nr:chemotaxis protein CheA [Palleronia abyssalis]SPJ23594.1 Chemotaxis protein CheA [Palleronia abyssalis]
MNPAAESFIQEARDILDELEGILLELEAQPRNPEKIDAVFRALHTLKGSGAMFGFVTLSEFTHHFENAYEKVRTGVATVTPKLIQLSLSSRDHLERMLNDGPDEDGTPSLDDETNDLIKKIETLYNEEGGEESEADNLQRIRIRFKPDESALRNGMRPDLILEELADLGESSVIMIYDDVPNLPSLDPTVCHIAWYVDLKTSAPRNAVEDVFIFASDWELSFERIIEERNKGLVDGKAKSANSEPQADADQPVSKPSKTRAGSQMESVRVQSFRLDELMDQLGELVIAQARLNRISSELGDVGLAGTAEEVERLVTGLRDTTLSIRMLPLELVFGKFKRVVRDLSNELGKNVTLKTDGGETEVDKNVIDSLTEPLVHIIRNSIDHGIESPDYRKASGKPELAELTMAARQSGGEVLITVSDDGRGLDPDAIRKRGLERGLIPGDSDLTEDQLFSLIFEPGFSTAETLSSVSGRGVGMDAVRRVIDDLRGSVEVRSKRGQGTEVTLRLPLTLAIIEGLLVRVGRNSFVLPLSNVEECVELPPCEELRKSGRTLLRIREQLVPFLSLDTMFGFPREESDDRRVVITNVEGRRTGLIVDEVIGQHQTVIKPLSAYHRNIEGLAGSTILGDGAVALIIDAAAIVRRAQSNQRTAA